MKNIDMLLNEIESKPEIIEVFNDFKEHSKRKKAKSRIFGNELRSLSKEEIERLKEQGNRAENWDNILVAMSFKTDRIHSNSFYGQCIIGNYSQNCSIYEENRNNNLSVPSGLYNSTIKNSEVGNNVLIKDVSLLSNYIVEEESIILNCGTIYATGMANYGNDLTIVIGNETGGREIQSFAELNIDIAQYIVTHLTNVVFQEYYRDFVKRYTLRFSPSYGIVEKGARIINSRKIADVLVGPYSLVDGAETVENTTLLSSKNEKVTIGNGVIVKDCSIQWGCSVESMAIVDTSMLTEHSHVEKHGKVTSSVIGPNTGIAEGEVTSSLVGPFVGFHHQSLLIAAIWPEGKGNIGYGANVGSNHTSKAPDQEIYCGEGTFFGLGVNIKYPSNFSESPYSIIATGVSTLPQRLRFPFSLINKPSENITGLSPAYNEIFPAWVLSDNIYTVRRNEGKYRKRNKAKRMSFVFDVFRPEIVDMMIDARKRLANIGEEKNYYLESDIEGLGKNYLKEKNRLKAIKTYTFFIRYYVLTGIMETIEVLIANDVKPEENSVYRSSNGGPYWEHQKNLMIAEGLDKNSLSENLSKLLGMEETLAHDTEISKKKDDKRGIRIVPDYASSHVPAKSDSFVMETWRQYENLRGKIQAYGIIG